MASAIDDSPVQVLVSLKRGWHSPLEAYTLCLAWYRASTSREENANGQIYRTGRARVKLHARGAGPGGKRLGSHVVETNAQALIEVLRSIPGPRHLCLEEGTLASWLYEVLSQHVEEIVVTAVSESRGPKSGQLDASGVAERLRIGATQRKVYKERGQFAALGHRQRGLLRVP